MKRIGLIFCVLLAASIARAEAPATQPVDLVALERTATWANDIRDGRFEVDESDRLRVTA